MGKRRPGEGAAFSEDAARGLGRPAGSRRRFAELPLRFAHLIPHPASFIPSLFRSSVPRLYRRRGRQPSPRADTTMEAAILAWLQNLAIRAFGVSLFLL